MTYRVKIETRNDGSKRYFPQIRSWGTFGFWDHITVIGCWNMKMAIEYIDENYGNKVKSIEFIYINK